MIVKPKINVFQKRPSSGIVVMLWKIMRPLNIKWGWSKRGEKKST
jgi:hypothetical protein